MPEMSRLERAYCRSAPWRVFARRVVLPWALQGSELRGDVLEIGAGSGAMAEGILEAFPGVRLTATDYDPAMVEMAARRLARFGDRARVQEADATALDFPDAGFDAVLSFIMLHHVMDWERALDEAVRVLRPGGLLVGYDLVASTPAKWLHQAQRERYRLVPPGEFRTTVHDLRLDDVRIRPAMRGLAMRFVARRAADEAGDEAAAR